jgi:hypothetical protein
MGQDVGKWESVTNKDGSNGPSVLPFTLELVAVAQWSVSSGADNLEHGVAYSDSARPGWAVRVVLEPARSVPPNRYRPWYRLLLRPMGCN